jgi:hypothetical protein
MVLPKGPPAKGVRKRLMGLTKALGLDIILMDLSSLLFSFGPNVVCQTLRMPYPGSTRRRIGMKAQRALVGKRDDP